jgi:hypothetical protein
MMKNEVITQSYVLSDLVPNVGQKICEWQLFTIPEILCEFTQIACTVFYEIITVTPDHH